MINFELVVIETVDDAMHVASVGVYNFPIDDTECDNCGMLTGPVAGDFFPCALAACVDEDGPDVERATVLCLDCIAPILFPGEGDEDDDV